MQERLTPKQMITVEFGNPILVASSEEWMDYSELKSYATAFGEGGG